MENENENFDSQNEEQLEGEPTLENTNTPDETPEEVSEGESSEENSLEERLEELELKNKQLYARLKKKETKPKKTNKEQTLTREEVVFLAKGGTEEDIEQLKSLGGSFKEAMENPMFKAWKDQQLQRERSEKAQLDPSTGSPTKKEKPVGNMTEDEHRDFFNQRVGNDKRAPIMPGR